ncbi:MAG: PilZ domain-containing protein [Acidobacteria bacterium]|nr:PilZ domain-containing protein [Acidobacteriota bacterium]MBV9482833.1 PilZ domain-containing protein [Acidobacteriota bacterium]
MSNNGRSASSRDYAAARERLVTTVFPHSQRDKERSAVHRERHSRYPDMQSAARFPIKLPLAVKSECGDHASETQNISANGVMFQVDSDMPVGSRIDFTISFPAEVVGSDKDVRVDCRGRVVRNFEGEGRRGVGVVIDEYHFER